MNAHKEVTTVPQMQPVWTQWKVTIVYVMKVSQAMEKPVYLNAIHLVKMEVSVSCQENVFVQEVTKEGSVRMMWMSVNEELMIAPVTLIVLILSEVIIVNVTLATAEQVQ